MNEQIRYLGTQQQKNYIAVMQWKLNWQNALIDADRERLLEAERMLEALYRESLDLVIELRNIPLDNNHIE